jgi:hypothetical protein
MEVERRKGLVLRREKARNIVDLHMEWTEDGLFPEVPTLWKNERKGRRGWISWMDGRNFWHNHLLFYSFHSIN